MRRTLEEELRKALEICEEALRNANRQIESLALANQTLAASDRAHMAKIEQLQREVDLYTDILRSICRLLELPHSESGPCDGVGHYTRAIESLQTDLAKTEAERVEHSRARYKAEAEIEQLKGVIREAKYFIEDDFPNGVDGPSIATKRYRDYYRSILAALEGGAKQ
jgi:chromosome segregation ATPase